MEEEGAHEPPAPEELLAADGQKGESGFFSGKAHGRLSILQWTVPFTLAHKATVFRLSGGGNKREKPRSWEGYCGEIQGRVGKGMLAG